MESVSIITLAIRQDSGEFEKIINSVWSTRDAALSELNRLLKNHNKPENGFKARKQLMQPTDMIVEYHGEVKYFYQILDMEVSQ